MTTVEIHDDKFTIDGEVTYKGRDWRGYPIEGTVDEQSDDPGNVGAVAG